MGTVISPDGRFEWEEDKNRLAEPPEKGNTAGD
jgi:hypothetical protein